MTKPASKIKEKIKLMTSTELRELKREESFEDYKRQSNRM